MGEWNDIRFSYKGTKTLREEKCFVISVAPCEDKLFYSICYDVKDDSRRLKVAKVLKDFGTRVQLSVFEAELDDRKVERLKNRVRKVLNDEEDTLRIYPLCAACMSRIEIIGQGVVTQDPDIIVI